MPVAEIDQLSLVTKTNAPSATAQLKKLVRITTVPQSLQILLKHQLRFMSSHFSVLAIASQGKELKEFGVEEGIKTVAVNMTRAITPMKDMLALFRLFVILRKEKPDIVHTHTPKAGLLGMLAAKLAGVPVRMHTVAGLPLMEARGIKRKILEWSEIITYSCATKVYANSFHLSTFIQMNGFCRASKIKVLGNGSSNGINTNYFRNSALISAKARQMKKVMGIAAQDFTFLFIGRLVKDKGIEELVEAFILLQESNPNTRLLLVGPYEQERDPISDRIKNIIEAHPAIIKTGFQKDVRAFLEMSDVLVFPSYREGFPNVPMQAGCFNLPTIATDINGCNEIIKNGINGILIPTKQVAQLNTAMQSLLENKSLYQSLKRNARTMITTRYEQSHFWNLLLQEYNQQLKIHSFVSKTL